MMVSVNQQIAEFRSEVANRGYSRKEIQDMIFDLSVEEAGLNDEMSSIVEKNKFKALDGNIDWQREWAMIQGRRYVIQMKKGILLSLEYAKQKLKSLNDD